MPKSARKVDHLFHKNGSPNWYVRLQDPHGGGDKIQSLKTPDKAQAQILASDYIKAHRAKLLAARPRIETTWQHQLEPGREHAAPNGGKIVATDKELIHISHNGAITRTEPNGSPAHQLVSHGPLTVRSLAEAFIEADFGAGRGERRTMPIKNGDDAIFETYIKHANISGYSEREARAVWALYKTLTESKPLKDATRDDGRKLVTHFEGDDPENPKMKSATIQKKLMWLSAACSLAIKEGRLKFNPFSSVVPKRDDKQTRLPLNDADIARAKRNLSDKEIGLDNGDQLLFRLLAATGMRLSEAFDINGEATERGIRYVIAGKKTEQSERRIPLPAHVLPHLPKAIKGPLFDGGPAAASKRLNRFLRDVGIADPRKVVHSLRHRAQDRLRAAGCPQDIRWAILGHEEKTVAAGYGEGFPVMLLRKWIDKIGF